VKFDRAQSYWSEDTDYASANGGNFDFIIDPAMHSAMPQEEAFWDYLFSTSYQWSAHTPQHSTFAACLSLPILSRIYLMIKYLCIDHLNTNPVDKTSAFFRSYLTG
jgi:hypothetical protein